jgi:hypothetical protein
MSAAEVPKWLSDTLSAGEASSPHPPRSAKTRRGREVASYDYREHDGTPRYQVVRVEPKRFLQRRPGPGGTWIWNLDGVTPLLYRLPQLAAAPPGSTIYITEGEKDADRLAALGLITTTCSGGAGKWRAEFTRWLSGHKAVVLVDNDDAGRAHARAVARAIKPAAADVKILELPGLPPKGDVSDWLDAGGDQQSLEALVMAAPATPSKDNRAAVPRRFPLIAFNEMRFDNTQRHLVRDLIPRDGVVVLYGAPKCGKTFLAFDLGLHVALGWPYRGRAVCQGPVVYIGLEGARGIRARIEAFRRRRLQEDPGTIPLHVLSTQLNLAAEVDQLITDLSDQLPGGCVAIIIDTLNRSLAGSESSDQDMGAYIKALDRLAAAFQAVVIVVHHSGIDGGRPRGHSSLAGAVDGQIAVRREQDGRIVAKLEQLKDGAEGDEFVSTLEVVDLGVGADGEEITSCVVAHVDKPMIIRVSRGLSPANRRALELLVDAVAREGVVPDANEHLPVGQSCVTVSQWRESCDRGLPVEKDDAKRQAFNRARRKLLEEHLIGNWDQWVWVIGRR